MAKQRELQQLQYILIRSTSGQEENVIIEYLYTPGDPGIAYYSNGDPGHPPTSPEVDILNVIGTNEELRPVDYELMEEAIINHEESKHLWN